MSSRALATIARIRSVEPHPNADRLDLVRVRGWQVVTGRGEFCEGDLCVFCEIDAKLPPPATLTGAPQGKSPWGALAGTRIKTRKIRGHLSQGVCYPLSEFGVLERLLGAGVGVGQDVTTLLGVTHGDYGPKEPKEPKEPQGETPGRQSPGEPFPTPQEPELRRTEQPRLQNIDPEELTRDMGGRRVCYTEKLDGTSATYAIFRDGTFHVCSRNRDLTLAPAATQRPFPDNSEKTPYWRFATYDKMEAKLRRFGTPLGIQGELCGPNIGNNPYKLGSLRFYVFDIVLLDQGRYLTWPELTDVCQYLGLDTVPYVADGAVPFADHDALLQFAEGRSALCPQVQREGIVCRTLWGLPQVSFKVVSNQYLCHSGKTRQKSSK